MSSIDERVVEMKFNNQQFEQNIKTTVDSLANLNKSLNMQGATKGLEQVQAAGNRFNLSNMAAGVDSIASKFTAMGAVGFTVIQKLTDAAMGFVKSAADFVWDPLVNGGKQRAQNIELAKFQFKGLKMNVEKAMEDALYAVKDTAFGLDEAAKAASQLGASGVKLGTDMKSSLRAISGVAAMTGSSYTDIAQVFTTVAGNGRLMANELNRLSARGINAAAILGTSMGKTEKEIREMVSDGKISFKEFSKAMDGAFGEHAKKANETYEGSLKNLRAAFARIGAAFATPNFEKMRVIFNALTPVIDKVKESLAPLITLFEDFSKGSGNDIARVIKGLDVGPVSDFGKAINTLSNGLRILWQMFNTVMEVGAEAFGNIFPPESKQYPGILERIALGFNKVVLYIKDMIGNGASLYNTIGGFFSIFSIAGQILGKVFGMFAELFGYANKGSGSFLDFTGNIGLWLMKVDDALKKGEGLGQFFDKLTELLKKPIDMFKNFGSSVMSALGGLGDFLSSLFDKIANAVRPADKAGGGITATFQKIGAALKAVWEFFSPVADMIANGMGRIGEEIRNAISQMGIADLQKLAGTGFLVMIGQLIARFVMTFGQAAKATMGMTTTFKLMLTTITNHLKLMSAAISAEVIRKIAIAIGILAVSLLILSMVPSDKLAGSLLAMMLFLKGIMIAFAEFDKMATDKGVFKMAAIGFALMGLAIAIAILAAAVKLLSTMEWEGLAKGLIGVGTLLGALTLYQKFATVNKGAIGQGAALILMAVGISILAQAVKVFASMSWEDLAKGGAAIAGSLLMIAGGMRLMPKNMLVIAAGIQGVAVAMLILSFAFKSFAGMSWEGIAKGAAAMAGSMLIIAGAMRLMPKNMMLTSISLLLVAAAITILSGALTTMGNMGWENIGKGLVVLASSLLIIAGTMALMTNALAGAVALIIVAGALMLLVPVMTTFGNMSWEQIGAGLAMLAGTLLILGIAGMAIVPALPGLFGLAAAIALLGIGVLAAGVGLLAFAAGLTMLSVAAATGSVALVALVSTFIGLIPMILTQIGLGIIGILGVIAQSGQAFIEAAVTLFTALLEAVVIVTPKVIDALMVLINALLDALVENVPKFVDKGMKIIKGFLKGIADNIGDVVREGLRIVKEFIKGIGDGLPGVVEEGINTVIKFVNGVADGIVKHSEEMGRAGGKLAAALVEGMAKGTLAGVSSIVDAAKRIAQSCIDTIKNVLGIHSPSKVMAELGKFAGEGFYRGLMGMQEPIIHRVVQTITEMKDKLTAAIKESDSEVKALEKKLKKQKKQHKSKKEINKTKKALAEAKNANKAEKAAQDYLDKNMKDQQERLIKLSDEYDVIGDKIASAADALRQAEQDMANAEANFKNQYSSLPEFAQEGDLVNQYLDSMKTQIEATKKFTTDLAELRKNGLDDKTYEKLLAKGLDAQPFITALLESGQIGIDEINRLDKDLDSTAGDLGKTASKELYQAGVDAAAGLLKGLVDQHDAIEAEMKSIADAMVKAIKDALGIHSPSREFAKIGGYSVVGLANGLQKMLPTVEKASEDVGYKAMTSLKNALSGASDILSSGMDMNPTIRPVIDLSDVEKGSKRLNGMLKAKELGITTSYDRASAIALAAHEAAQAESEMADATVGEGDTFTLNQYINSPKAVSNGDIYRQTKNGVSVIKGRIRR